MVLNHIADQKNLQHKNDIIDISSLLSFTYNQYPFLALCYSNCTSDADFALRKLCVLANI